MSYADLAIGAGFFIFFVALILSLSIQYFVEKPSEVSIEEYRRAAVDIFARFFSSPGKPDDWEEGSDIPSELGLKISVYKNPIKVEEPGISNRVNEPVIVKVYFDEDCDNRAWNNTVRIYNSTLDEHKFEFVRPRTCPSSPYQLNQSYIRFMANISKGGSETFNLFFYNDSEIPSPNYSVSYNTSGWIPSTGDDWSDGIASWGRYGGSSDSPSSDSLDKMRGSSSVSIQDTFDSNNTLGLIYQPGSPITGVSNGWYFDCWVYVDDVSGLEKVNVSIGESDDIIVSSTSISNLENDSWYHFERKLASNKWESWNGFDASNGIDNFTVYMINSTSGINRQMNLDEVHFEIEPLKVQYFPEEQEGVISSKKISALNNLTYEELKDVTGEDYKFRIEIVD